MIEQQLERIAKALEAIVEIAVDGAPGTSSNTPVSDTSSPPAGDHTVGKKKTKKKRRTKAQIEADNAAIEGSEPTPEHEDDGLFDTPGDPKPSTAAKPEEQRQDTVTVDDIKEEVRSLIANRSPDVVREIFSAFGAECMSEVKEEDYPSVFAKLKAARLEG